MLSIKPVVAATKAAKAKAVTGCASSVIAIAGAFAGIGKGGNCGL